MNPEKNTPTEGTATVQPFVITRTLNAPRDLVWKAWTEPERLAQWWGPKGCAIKVHQLDLRPGGIFHYTMSFPGGGEDMWCRFAFREVTAPDRIAWVNSFSDAEGGITRPPFDENWPLEILNEVTLTEENGKTLLTLCATPINATTAEVQTFDTNRASLNQGYSGTWDQLVEYLAQAKVSVPEEANRELINTRFFKAPRELVFEAWTKPEHVAHWYGPNGFTLTIHEMDVRPGGMWRYIMHGPDGTDYDNRVVYEEISRPSRLVYLHGSDKDNDPEAFHVTVTFEDEDGGTRLTMRLVMATAEQREASVKFGAVEGGKQTLSRLDAYLPTMTK